MGRAAARNLFCCAEGQRQSAPEGQSQGTCKPCCRWNRKRVTSQGRRSRTWHASHVLFFLGRRTWAAFSKLNLSFQQWEPKWAQVPYFFILTNCVLVHVCVLKGFDPSSGHLQVCVTARGAAEIDRPSNFCSEAMRRASFQSSAQQVVRGPQVVLCDLLGCQSREQKQWCRSQWTERASGGFFRYWGDGVLGLDRLQVTSIWERVWHPGRVG